MSTLAEIEKSIEGLPSPQVDELMMWLLRRRERPVGAVGAKRSVRELIGKFAPDDGTDADNERIDADLAAFTLCWMLQKPRTKRRNGNSPGRSRQSPTPIARSTALP